MKNLENEIICTSYFKREITKSSYTNKWIEVINQLEKNKSVHYNKK